MKKLLLAVSAFGMLMTSCQNDLDLGTVAGETSQVTFSVGTPQIATRAFSSGETATVLKYAVYDAEGNELTDLTVTDAEIHGSTTVNLQLTTGNTYSVIFWAAAENAPYDVNFAAKTMTVNYDAAVSNDENRDAFYKYHKFTVTGAQTETIELKRPFAQLNIGTSDFAASETAGYKPTKSAVVVKNIYNTLDLVEGVVSGETEVTYDYALIPNSDEETFPVAGYDYLAMNYLLVAKDKELVDVVFSYTETDATAAKTRTVGSVPVQRNHRTNIYGQLLTSDVDVNVEIVPPYDEPSHELDALWKAALNGGEVTLTEDVVLTSTLEVVGNMTINLNGKTISGEFHKNVGPVIKNNGTLKINGGTISSVAENGGSAIANYGNLTVEGATINGAPQAQDGSGWPAYPVNNYGDLTLTNTSVTGYQGCIALNAAGTTVLNDCVLTKEYLETSSHVFYVNNADAKLVINGGTYTHNGFDGSLVFAAKGEVVINDGTFNAKDGGYGPAVSTADAKIVIKGGNINAGLLNWGGQFVINGGVFASEPNASYLAEGYKAVKMDSKWYVVAEGVEVVLASTGDQLKDALAAETDGTKIILAAGTYSDLSFTNPVTYKAKNVTIVGEDGVTIDGFSVNGWSADNNIVVEGLTFENVTFTKGLLLSTKVMNNVTVENCKFVNDACIHQNDKTEKLTGLKVVDCDFTGDITGTTTALMLENTEDVTVTGSTFTNIDFNVLQGGILSGTILFDDNIVNGTGDRVFRFVSFSSDADITISNNTITSEGDDNNELAKSTNPVAITLTNNTWNGQTDAQVADKLINITAK